MTTSSRNYNHLALRGQAVDDMEVVEEYGLDPKLAYTPAINDAALDAEMARNVEFYTSKGMDPKEAQAKAKQNRMSAAKNIKKLMK